MVFTLSLVTSQNFTYGNSVHQKLPKRLPKVKLDEVNIELIPSLVTSLNLTYGCSFHQKKPKSLPKVQNPLTFKTPFDSIL